MQVVLVEKCAYLDKEYRQNGRGCKGMTENACKFKIYLEDNGDSISHI